MIGTLLAQEFRSTRKNLLSTVGVALLVVLVSLTLTALKVPVLGSVTMLLGIAVAVAVTPIVLGLLVENYWRSMYGREGYFTMALPVRGRTLFAAKALYGFVVALVALLITLSGLLGAGIAYALSIGRDPGEFLREGLAMIQPWMVWFGVIVALLQVGYLVVAGAAIMSIGAQGRFNHLGFGAPVIGGVIVYVVMQIVTFAAILFIPLGVVLTGEDAGSVAAEGMLPGFIASIQHQAAPHVLGLGFVVTSLAAIVLLAWWGIRSIERHTSLR